MKKVYSGSRPDARVWGGGKRRTGSRHHLFLYFARKKKGKILSGTLHRGGREVSPKKRRKGKGLRLLAVRATERNGKKERDYLPQEKKRSYTV